MNILVVAAHPDDEVLGCGATIAKLAAFGHEILPVILGQGAMSRGETHVSEVDKLTQAAKNAALILGTKPPLFFDLPDNRFDSLDLLDIVKIVQKLIGDTQPELILTHHAHDLNIDHRITFQAVLTAARPMDDSSVREILCFEIPSSTEWGFGKIGPPFNPSVFYDVTEHFDTKVKALTYYDMEMRDFPHPRSLKNIQIMAEKWGSAVGCKCCEAYEIIFLKR